MKGLVLNNLYLVVNSIKASLLVCAFAIMGYIVYPTDLTLFIEIFAILIILPFTSLSTVSVSKSSKWSYLEDYMPVTKKKLIMSRYATFLLISIIALCIFISIDLFYYIMGDNLLIKTIEIPTLRSTTGMEVAKIYFFQAQLIAIFYFPLVYFLKQDKSDTITFISVGISLIAALFIKSWNIWIIAILIIVLYVASFELSCVFYKEKR